MNEISKEGIVREIKENCVLVAVTNCSACHQCQAKNFCGLSEKTEKIIEIETSKASEYKQGETVIVLLKSISGFYALFLGYILPLLLVLGAVLTFSWIGYDDIISGISGIIILIPYYFGLFFLNKKLKSIFSFELEHKN